MAERQNLCLSIVSHGQGRLVARLLDDLAQAGMVGFEVLLTLNIPEDESFIGERPYPLRVLRNAQPLGFGANHNQAFGHTACELFAVVNPDIRMPAQDWSPLLERLREAGRIAACSPRVLNSAGSIEDHARSFPTIARLVARRLGRAGPEPATHDGPDPFEPDWLAGMFVVFKSSAFRQVGGFDAARFFMYFEDVDICRRLRARGWTVCVDPRVAVVHDAQRASQRNLRHFRWHLTSAFRYLTGI